MVKDLWFKTYYPEEGTCILRQDTANFGKKREEIEKLTLIRAKGQIDMKGFTGLKHLELLCDEIETLDLSDCKELEYLRLQEGIFDKLDLSKNTKLVDIFLDRWKKPANLNIFSHLTKLKKLNIEGSNFSGSLKDLSDCKELEYLNLSDNKNVNEGLEYLPETISAENVYFEGSGVYEALEPFGYDLNMWRVHHKETKK